MNNGIRLPINSKNVEMAVFVTPPQMKSLNPAPSAVISQVWIEDFVDTFILDI